MVFKTVQWNAHISLECAVSENFRTTKSQNIKYYNGITRKTL